VYVTDSQCRFHTSTSRQATQHIHDVLHSAYFACMPLCDRQAACQIDSVVLACLLHYHSQEHDRSHSCTLPPNHSSPGVTMAGFSRMPSSMTLLSAMYLKVSAQMAS
jgi:hypothetical protein